MTLFRHENTIYEQRTQDLLVQVVDRGEQRELRFGNHVTQSAISRVNPDVLVLDYARAMVVGLVFAPLFERFLHIGLGGGAVPRFIHRHLPGVHQRVVELSPEVIQVAYRFFDLPRSERLEVVASEGAEFLRTDKERYQLIFLDAFHADGPAAHLSTQPFFNMLRTHLAPGGFLVNNVWGSDRANLYRIRESLRATFPQLYHLSVRANSNVIFFAGRDARLPTISRLRGRAQTLSKRTSLDFEGMLALVKAIRSSETGQGALA